MTKKEEVGRLLKARQDPSLQDKVLLSELSPAQKSKQDQMKKSFAVSIMDDGDFWIDRLVLTPMPSLLSIRLLIAA